MTHSGTLGSYYSFMMKYVNNETGKTLLDLVAAADSCDGSDQGRLIVVAGGPRAGAMELVLWTMSHIAVRQNRPVGLISHEMDSKEVVDRLITTEAEIDSAISSDSRLSVADFKAWSEAAGRIYNAPIFIDDQAPCTTDQLPAVMRTMVMYHSLHCVVLDCLGLVRLSDASIDRGSRYGKFYDDLKEVAEDTGVTMLLVAELSQDSCGRQPALNQL